MRIFLVAALASVLLSACQSSMSVSSDYDKSIDFSSYKTFQLLPWGEDLKSIVQQNSRTLINDALIYEMTQKGFSYVEKGADLVVSPFVHIDEQMGTTAYTTHYGMGGYGYYGGFGYGMGTSQTTYNNYVYEVGSLIVDVYDQRQKKLVWQAVGSVELNDNPKKVQRNIPTYVRQVVHDFPRQGSNK